MSEEEAGALIAALREQLAQQEAANQALREQVARLEQRSAEREALQTPPPG